MRNGKQNVPSVEIRPGYVKRYEVDHAQTEKFHLSQYHTALGAKAALTSKLAKADVRVRLRLRRDRFELQVKVPKEVKVHVPDVTSQEKVPQSQTSSVASHVS